MRSYNPRPATAYSVCVGDELINRTGQRAQCRVKDGSLMFLEDLATGSCFWENDFTRWFHAEPALNWRSCSTCHQQHLGGWHRTLDGEWCDVNDVEPVSATE